MKHVRLTLLAVLVVAALAPLAAQASHCSSRVIIFSGNSAGGGRAINSSALTCSVLDHDADSRIINPGSDFVSVRYTLPSGGTCVIDSTITGTLNGLGHDNATITLTCSQDATLGFYRYQSSSIPIDPFASGCITARVEAEENTFHTVDSLGC